jgi:hypothetical protein
LRPVGGSDGVGLGVSTQLVAGSEQGPTADTAPGKHHAITMWPVITPGSAVGAWCAAELSHGNDERRVEQTTRCQVVDQGRKRQGLRITIAKLGYMGSFVSRANPDFCRTVLRLSDSVVTNTVNCYLRNII